MDEKLCREIDGFIEDNSDSIFRDIARLVKINSVEGEPLEGAPFGIGPRRALDLGLQIAQELGLATRDCEGKMGYATIGSGEKYLATITHLDVVPTGDGWSADPFTMRERDGYIIGRGVMDDKGPSVLCLYALKYLKDKKIPLNYEVRALLGVSEETGMKDIEYYLENYPAPAFCFSPDANFPLCNGEKGIYHGRIISKKLSGNIVDINGGIVVNAVPDKAEAWVKAEKLKSTKRVEAAFENGVWHLTAHGIGGHASMPQGTVNAIGVLVNYILDNRVADAEEEKYLRLIALMHEASDGSALGIDAADGRFEPLTAVGGVISMENGVITSTIDCRYPTNTSGANIASIIEKKSDGAATVTVDTDSEPFYMELDNPAVQVCINAYNGVTGENAKPYTIGGGTYARDFPNAVSFGPEHPERPQPDFAGPIHGVDEAASKAFFLEALKIYIIALIELQKIDF